MTPLHPLNNTLQVCVVKRPTGEWGLPGGFLLGEANDAGEQLEGLWSRGASSALRESFQAKAANFGDAEVKKRDKVSRLRTLTPAPSLNPNPNPKPKPNPEPQPRAPTQTQTQTRP